MWVLQCRDQRGFGYRADKTQYYGGKTYTVQGEKYACIEPLEKCKRYKSQKVAERVCERIYLTTRGEQFEVIFIEENINTTLPHTGAK